jgi:hypothetical protein
MRKPFQVIAKIETVHANTSRDFSTSLGMRSVSCTLRNLARDKDDALEKLSILSKIPSDVNCGMLRLDPIFLHGDPRFEKIVAARAERIRSSPTSDLRPPRLVFCP